MKINKFNESVEIYDTKLPYDYGYVEYENSNSWILNFYNTGGYVDGSILFNNKKDAENYVLNYVNHFILNVEIEDDYKPDEFFTDYVYAMDWFNDFNADTEPSIDLINVKKAENIKFDEKFNLLNSTNKYNL